MKEIGGYIEFEHYDRPMMHENGIKLNCGRNALAYLLEAYNIHKIAMPKFMCDSCDSVLKAHNVEVRYYSISIDFKSDSILASSDEWLYVVNYYGQLSNGFISKLKEANDRLILDNAQAYFQEPLKDIPTLYTCRKFFGVADGAILYSDKTIEVDQQDESFERMKFLLGRYERTASEFYSEYVNNNHLFSHEPIKRMSKLTENLLRGIDYGDVKKKRTENFSYLHKRLGEKNKLNLSIPKGAFMYPLYIDNGTEIRKKLQAKKIFIPILWPAVFNICSENELEYDMANNILPIPVDQRYGTEDMEYIIQELKEVEKTKK